MVTHQRRNTDITGVHVMHQTEEKILELIEETGDAKDKAFLLILLKLNNSLTDNTLVVHEVASRVHDVSSGLEKHLKEFGDHLTTDTATIAREEGAKRVWAYVLGICQVIIFATVAYFNSELSNIRNDVVTIKTNIATVQANLNIGRQK